MRVAGVDRDTAVAPGHLGAAPRRDALRRLRPAPGLDHVHAAQPVPRGDGGGAASSGRIPRPCAISTCARRTAMQVPLARSAGSARATPLAVNHQGQFPALPSRSTCAPGVSLGDAVTAIDAAGRASVAGQHARQLPGHGAGVPGVARQRAAPDPGRAADRLYRARHALRELHPPDHHPLHLPSAGVGALLALLLCDASSTSSR